METRRHPAERDDGEQPQPANGGVLSTGIDGTYFYVVANQPPNTALLHALDPAQQGADAWPAIMIPSTVWGAPSVANGVLVVPAGTALNFYNAKTGDKLNSFETGGTIAAGAAAIVDGRVIVQSGLQSLTTTPARTTTWSSATGCERAPRAWDVPGSGRAAAARARLRWRKLRRRRGWPGRRRWCRRRRLRPGELQRNLHGYHRRHWVQRVPAVPWRRDRRQPDHERQGRHLRGAGRRRGHGHQSDPGQDTRLQGQRAPARGGGQSRQQLAGEEDRANAALR